MHEFTNLFIYIFFYRLSMIGDRLSVGGGSDRLSVGGTGHMAADRLSLHSAGGMENGGKPLYNGVVKYANHRDSHYSKSGANNPPAVGNSARYSANSGIHFGTSKTLKYG